jgi:hypothetical protein
MQTYFYQMFLSAADKIILVIGGGGKSCLIKRLAADGRGYGKTSVIASLYPMPFPYESSTLISRDAELIRRQLKSELEKSRTVFIGKKIDKNHILPFTPRQLSRMIAGNPGDHFFIEADQTMGRSVSGYEKILLPIPFTCDLILNVVGADALNQQRNENWTLSKNKNLLRESLLTPNLLARIYSTHPKLSRLSRKGQRLIFFLNKSENLYVENLALQMAKNLKTGGFDKVMIGSIFNSTLYQLK